MKKSRRPRNPQSPQTVPKPPRILLFDLNNDVGEQNNVAEEYPEIVNRLQARMEELDAEITENARAPWTKG